LKLLTKFKGIVIPQLNQGSSILMWQDMWNNGVRSLQMLGLDDLHNIFHLPLFEEAYQQFMFLQQEMESLPANQENDR
jgi:hypothetical protein